MPIIFFILFCSYASFAASESFPADSLKRGIESIFAKSGLGGKWGVDIWSVGRQREVLGVRADELFMPASTGKLFVTAAALDAFPDNYRFKTRLELYGRKKGNTFRGRLKIIGYGDPGLSERFYPENQPLIQWIDTLRSWGIDTLIGEVVADDGYFQERHPVVWKRAFFDDWYGAEPASLSWQDNLAWMSISPGPTVGSPCRIQVKPDVGQFNLINKCVTKVAGGHNEQLIRDEFNNSATISGPVGKNAGTLRFRATVRDPAQYLRLAFLQLMPQNGLIFQGDSGDMDTKLNYYKGFDFFGITLEQSVLVTNSRSHNLFAEMMLRSLSQLKYKSGNVANGLRAIQDFLRKNRIPTDQYKMVDGSGLSYDNRISPRLQARLLSSMIRHPKWEIFYKSLAAPGFGTGGKRMGNLRYADITRFKTGFVNGTQGLSGYILSSDGDTLSVSLLLNGYKGNDDRARIIMDKAWTLIAEYVNAERQAQLEMKSLWREVQNAPSWNQRLKDISETWLGKKYMPKPLGHGVWSMQNKDPLARTYAFDDRSFVEHVMAVAYAPKQEYIFDALMQIRYFGAKVGFQDYRHFFIPDIFSGNPWLKEFVFPGSVKGERILNRQKIFALAGLKYPGSNAKVQLKYLPVEEASRLFSKPWSENSKFLGMALVPKMDDQWNSQLGFLILDKGTEPVYRYANSIVGKVVDVPFKQWLMDRGSAITGLYFWDMKSPF